MTTEEKALALVKAVSAERCRLYYTRTINRRVDTDEALCRAIEQHEVFKQEVSDVVRDALPWCEPQKCVSKAQWVRLSQLITKPKPDPLVKVLLDMELSSDQEEGQHDAKWLRLNLEARGLEIREKGQ